MITGGKSRSSLEATRGARRRRGDGESGEHGSGELLEPTSAAASGADQRYSS